MGSFFSKSANTTEVIDVKIMKTEYFESTSIGELHNPPPLMHFAFKQLPLPEHYEKQNLPYVRIRSEYAQDKKTMTIGLFLPNIIFDATYVYPMAPDAYMGTSVEVINRITRKSVGDEIVSIQIEDVQIVSHHVGDISLSDYLKQYIELPNVSEFLTLYNAAEKERVIKIEKHDQQLSFGPK